MRAGLVLLTLVVAACGGAGPRASTSFSPPTTFETSEDLTFEEARDAWKDAAIDHYRITYERTCLCPPETVGVFEVEVDHGEVVSARRNGEELSVDAVGVHTVDALFSEVVDGYRGETPGGGSYIGVDYHPELGYPVRVEGRWQSPDGVVEMEDEEEITVVGFEDLR